MDSVFKSAKLNERSGLWNDVQIRSTQPTLCNHHVGDHHVLRRLEQSITQDLHAQTQSFVMMERS